MSDILIRAALETRLANQNPAPNPAVDTVHENEAYDPVGTKAYQMVTLLPAQPENPEIGSAFKRLLGIFQVSLFYPQSTGPGNAAAQAEALRTWFPRGLSLVNGGVTVIISATPYIMQGSPDGDRWMVPVRIPYYANV